jgi:hypothetical protein
MDRRQIAMALRAQAKGMDHVMLGAHRMGALPQSLDLCPGGEHIAFDNQQIIPPPELPNGLFVPEVIPGGLMPDV